MNSGRYERQMRFAPIGELGQRRLAEARVLIVGVGALGSVVAELLARAGVGYLRLIDRDFVEWSNLQRQSLYTEADAELSLAKVQAAANQLERINRDVRVEAIAADLHTGNVTGFFESVDLVVDGTDNFETRYLINDVAWKLEIPWIHGGCVGATGQAFAFRPGKTICLRCLQPVPPDPSTVQTCDTAGVLGPATHLIGALQAIEAIKLLVGGRDAMAEDVLVSVDLWRRKFLEIGTGSLLGEPCPCCTLRRFDFLDGSSSRPQPQVLCGRNAVQLPGGVGVISLDLQEFAKRWHGLGEVNLSKFIVRLELNSGRSITLFRDGRAVIGGTEDIAEAKTVYARYIGS